MKKTLLLYSRICPWDSKFTIKLFNELQTLTNVTARKLDGSKPFDIQYEQEYIKQFDNVIVLFTINWFNLPWDMSRYMAEVWKANDFNLKDINFYTICTTGSPQKIYGDEGFGWTAGQYLNNFSSVLKRLKANYLKQFFFYNCMNSNPDDEQFVEFVESTKEWLENNL